MNPFTNPAWGRGRGCHQKPVSLRVEIFFSESPDPPLGSNILAIRTTKPVLSYFHRTVIVTRFWQPFLPLGSVHTKKDETEKKWLGENCVEVFALHRDTNGLVYFSRFIDVYLGIGLGPCYGNLGLLAGYTCRSAWVSYTVFCLALLYRSWFNMGHYATERCVSDRNSLAFTRMAVQILNGGNDRLVCKKLFQVVKIKISRSE